MTPASASKWSIEKEVSGVGLAWGSASTRTPAAEATRHAAVANSEEP